MGKVIKSSILSVFFLIGLSFSTQTLAGPGIKECSVVNDNHRNSHLLGIHQSYSLSLGGTFECLLNSSEGGNLEPSELLQLFTRIEKSGRNSQIVVIPNDDPYIYFTVIDANTGAEVELTPLGTYGNNLYDVPAGAQYIVQIHRSADDINQKKSLNMTFYTLK